MTGTPRRILLVGHDGTRVAHEAPFDLEDTLHQAIAAHPEALPASDVGWGALVTLASRLQLSTGEVDPLCADRSGRLAIVEFKKGTENLDARKVVAQLLDYGAGLWGLAYEDLEERCRTAQPGFSSTMAEHVAAELEALGEDPLDADAYQQAVESALEHGDFAFVYAARDVDDRTRRIATYLAEGPRLAFFAVEVDHFEDSDSGGRVLVPRTAFTPSWVAAGNRRSGSRLSTTAPGFDDAVDRVRQLASDLALVAIPADTGYTIRTDISATSIFGLYRTARGFEFNLESLREAGDDVTAAIVQQRVASLAGVPTVAARYPAVACQMVVDNWHQWMTEVFRPLVSAHRAVHTVDEG